MKFNFIILLSLFGSIQSELSGKSFVSFKIYTSSSSYSDTPAILKSPNVSNYNDLINEFYHIVTTSNHSGIIDLKGNLIVDTLFDAVSEPDLEHQIVWVKREMDYPPVINREDSSYENDEYDWSYENISGNWQLYNLNGKLLSDSFFNQPYEFNNGIAKVYCYGIHELLINNKGEFLTNFKAERIHYFNKYSCIIYNDSLFGFTDSNFNVIQAPYFDNMTHFVGDWALVLKHDTLGLINHDGTYIKDIHNYLSDESISISNLINFDTFINVYATYHHSSIDYYNCIPGFLSLDSIRQSTFKSHIQNHLILAQWRNLFLMENEVEMDFENRAMYALMADTFEYILPVEPTLDFAYKEFETEVAFCTSDLLSFYTCSIDASGNNKRVDEDRYYDYEFKHYVRKKDYWKQIDISNLFFGNYKALLKKLIIDELKIDAACTCENLQHTANLNLNHFTINEDGLEYFIYLCDTGVQIEASMNVLEIDIPYSDLKSVIPPTSPLFTLLRKLEAVKD